MLRLLTDPVAPEADEATQLELQLQDDAFMGSLGRAGDAAASALELRAIIADGILTVLPICLLENLLECTAHFTSHTVYFLF